MIDHIREILSGLARLFPTHLIHLKPDFSLLLDDPTNPRTIAVWFILLLCIIAFSTFLFVTYNGVRGIWRIRQLRRIVLGLRSEELASKRRELLSRFTGPEAKQGGIGHVWREFDDSLVVSREGDRLHNTLDAEHFFNTHSLARGVADSRLLAAVPSFLIAIGVLGTFVGLTVGLSGLQLGAAATVDDLRQGIQVMIAGAAVAFATSVWGVLLSVMINAYEKIWETGIKRSVAGLQDRIDNLFPRLTAEHSLNDIAGSSQESQKALQTLHEKIGDQLQEKLEAAGTQFQESLVGGVQAVMREALERMNTEANQQSTETLEKLVQQFMERMGETGEEQRKMLDSAADSMQGAVNQLGDQMSSLVDELSRQQDVVGQRAVEEQQRTEETSRRLQRENEERLLAMQGQFENLTTTFMTQIEQQQEQADRRELERQARLQGGIEALGAARERTETSISQFVEGQRQYSDRLESHLNDLLKHLESASGSIERSSAQLSTGAGSLEEMGGHLKEATGTFHSSTRDMTAQLGKMAKQVESVENQIEAQVQRLQSLQESLANASMEFQGSAKLASEGFKALANHQDAFLQSMRDNFGLITKTLRTQVEELEKQAEQWLRAYAEEVSRQTTDRMAQWDDQTRGFADNVGRSVQAISDVVDEIEGKVLRHAS